MSLNRENIEWLLALAFVYIQTNKASRAIALLNVVLLEQKEHPDAIKLASISYFKRAEFDKSFNYIKKWMTLTTTSRAEKIEMFLLQARVLLRLKRKDLARKCLVKYKTLIDEEEHDHQQFLREEALRRKGKK